MQEATPHHMDIELRQLADNALTQLRVEVDAPEQGISCGIDLSESTLSTSYAAIDTKSEIIGERPFQHVTYVKNQERNNIEKEANEMMMAEVILNNDTDSGGFGKSQSSNPHEESQTDWRKLLKQLYERIVTLEQQNREMSIALENQFATISNLRNSIHSNHEKALRQNCNGVFIWRLNSCRQLLEHMISDPSHMLFSPEFYTNPNGYKMCARINVTENKKYLSVVLHMMFSKNNDALDWPFHGSISFILIHPTTPNESIREKTVSTPNLEAFQKPICLLNKRGFGYTEFVTLSKIGQFFQNDQLIFRIEVKS